MSQTFGNAWISQLEKDLFEIRDRLIRFKQLQEMLPNGGRSEHAAAAYIEKYRPQLAGVSGQLAMLEASAQRTGDLSAESGIDRLSALVREIVALELELLSASPQDWESIADVKPPNDLKDVFAGPSANPFAAYCERLKDTQAKREYELRSFESQASGGPVPEGIDLEFCKTAWDASAHVFTLLFILAKVLQSRPRVARRVQR